jgi:TRAP-type mannitol/chloroaromatic compound transport system permease large subunit
MLDQDQDPVVVAASLELIVVIAVRMAVDGAMDQLPIVQHALAASTPLRALHSALAAALLIAILLVTRVAAASGVTTVAIAATMVQDGVISLAPIVEHAQERSTAVLLRQGAGELKSVVLPHASVSKMLSFMWYNCL